MSESFDLVDVDKLTVGAVGEPGRRVFVLQARHASQVVTLKLEKSQTAALAAYLDRLLEDLPDPTLELPEDLDLEEPTEPEWVIGSLGVAYDEALDRLVLVAEEAVDEDEQGARARISATREQVTALVRRGTELVQSGRPPCPLCGYPLDPAGHACPRANGHRPPTL
ncbi:MAG TPA: DUF3090 family protein [Acidimicrobiales bacterium]|nr:DUF3090 family protein [Acidimicrobiales bacterium]